MDAIGRKGEDAACVWLASKGHTVLERNWRGGRCEIDIITADTAGLHFVEVKSRKAPAAADPLVAVLIAVGSGEVLLRSGGRRYADAEVFFDIVTVIIDKETTYIQYYPQAFIPIYD